MRKEIAVFQQLEDWGKANDNIRAMLLTSSRTNPNAFTDIFSDYDVELFITNLQPFLNDGWLTDTFGEILVFWPRVPVENEQWITRLVIFADGMRIDFQISTVASLVELCATSPLPQAYANGYRVLLDKDNLTENILSPSYDSYLPTSPSEAEYSDCLQGFWWDITYVAKSLWRDELPFAKYMLGGAIRVDSVEKMLGWTIGVQHNWKANPNKHGRWFKRYLDAQTWQELESTYSGASLTDNWLALFNTTALMRRVAQLVANTFGFSYPHDLDERVSAYLVKIKNLPRDAKDF